jgi:hypothetical protein
MTLDLPTVVRSFEYLADQANTKGHLTPDQAQHYALLCSSWEYYRASQPEIYQKRVDELVMKIGNAELSV